MNFEEYKKVYLAYLRSLSQTFIIAIVSSEVLTDFPANLPANLREALTRDFRKLSAALLQAITAATTMASADDANGQISSPEEPGEPRSEEADKKPSDARSTSEGRLSQASSLFLMMALDLKVGGNRPKDHNLGKTFTTLTNYQALAMTFAHLDAFLGDSVRAICRVRPEVLRKDKKVAWSTVLEFPSLDAAVEHFTESLVYEFGWKSLLDRLKELEAQFALGIEADEEDVEVLARAEQKRHVIIHNAGAASQRYVAEVGGDQKIGSRILVSIEEVERIQDAARLLASAVFVAISKKFFNASDNDLTQVWRKSRNGTDGLKKKRR
jgi:hypothetical protein